MIYQSNIKNINQMRATDIVREAGMSSRPGSYSGRGATTSDLNGIILNRIKDLIKKHHGEDQSNNFVEMVKAMKTLSATAFLISLYELEGNGWSFRGSTESSDIYTDSIGSALGTIVSVMGGSRNYDDTESIKEEYLGGDGDAKTKWM